jgi:hypothetical protein
MGTDKGKARKATSPATKSKRVAPGFGKSRQIGFTETKDFNVGDSMVARMTRNADNTIDRQWVNKEGTATNKKRYTPSKALSDSKTKNNAGYKAVGSYALNYFKKNSK